jgi:hypothetical protein
MPASLQRVVDRGVPSLTSAMTPRSTASAREFGVSTNNIASPRGTTPLTNVTTPNSASRPLTAPSSAANMVSSAMSPRPTTASSSLDASAGINADARHYMNRLDSIRKRDNLA